MLIDNGGTGILRDAGIPAPPLRRGWRAGTPQYMAPELWAGRPHTVSTDIYAATGVLVDGLTGRPPYLGTDLTGLGVQHTQGALPSEAVPLLARELVIRGLAKDPRDRPASAGIFRRDVEVAGTAFLGAAWRDQGRAWLAVVVTERLADPVPASAPVEFLDEDDNAPLHGLAIDSAADETRPGGVGWKVWSVAAAAVIALLVMIVFAVQALGGPGVQELPTVPTGADDRRVDRGCRAYRRRGADEHRYRGGSALVADGLTDSRTHADDGAEHHAGHDRSFADSDAHADTEPVTVGDNSPSPTHTDPFPDDLSPSVLSARS